MSPECFDNNAEDFEYHIVTDPVIKPMGHVLKKIPLELKERLREELKQMEKNKIIVKVNGPTDWVNSIIVREKSSGQLKICLKPKDLNQAIKIGHYPTPTLEDITLELSGSKLFSTLDAKNGY